VDGLQQAGSHESDSIGAIVGSGDSAVAKMMRRKCSSNVPLQLV